MIYFLFIIYSKPDFKGDKRLIYIPKKKADLYVTMVLKIPITRELINCHNVSLSIECTFNCSVKILSPKHDNFLWH